MSDSGIELKAVHKRFRVARREAGLRAALKSVFRRETTDVDAVVDLSFSVAAGERVGFLGRNGAGKTTTLKMLAGLLYPTSGTIEVAGHRPQERRPEFLRAISLLMGQKRQLSWDLPALDTFELNRIVFDVPRDLYRTRLAEMDQLLELGDIVRRPVRQLSLGERMKCELVATLLHGPRVLFLDEPTIGMDVTMQAAIREFIRTYNQRTGATVVLTSHDMGDVAAICPRIIVIDGGRLGFDGGIEDLVRRVHPRRRVSVRVPEAQTPRGESLSGFGHVVECTRGSIVLDATPEHVPALVQGLLAIPGATDLTVQDPPLEQVVRELFASVRAGEGPS